MPALAKAREPRRRYAASLLDSRYIEQEEQPVSTSSSRPNAALKIVTKVVKVSPQLLGSKRVGVPKKGRPLVPPLALEEGALAGEVEPIL